LALVVTKRLAVGQGSLPPNDEMYRFAGDYLPSPLVAAAGSHFL